MAETLAPVTLRCEITIGGQTYAYQQPMPRREWETIQQDPRLYANYEHILRTRLGAAVMEQLQPPVTVHMPTPLDEAMMQTVAAELEATSCRCHNTDELCSGCRRCPHVCRGCDG